MRHAPRYQMMPLCVHHEETCLRQEAVSRPTMSTHAGCSSLGMQLQARWRVPDSHAIRQFLFIWSIVCRLMTG